MNKKSGSKVDVFTLVFFLHIFVAFVLVTLTKLGQESLVIVLTSAALFLVGFVIRSNKANKLDELREDLDGIGKHYELWESFQSAGEWEQKHQLLTEKDLSVRSYDSKVVGLVIEDMRNDLLVRNANKMENS